MADPVPTPVATVQAVLYPGGIVQVQSTCDSALTATILEAAKNAAVHQALQQAGQTTTHVVVVQQGFAR
jgi:TusA-related sulfurtransferase